MRARKFLLSLMASGLLFSGAVAAPMPAQAHIAPAASKAAVETATPSFSWKVRKVRLDGQWMKRVSVTVGEVPSSEGTYDLIVLVDGRRASQEFGLSGTNQDAVLVGNPGETGIRVEVRSDSGEWASKRSVFLAEQKPRA